MLLFIVHTIVCVETFSYLTREFYYFVKHINIQTFHFTSCEILKAGELPKPEWQTLLDVHHLFKQTNKSISNSWFQAFQILSVWRNLKKTLKKFSQSVTTVQLRICWEKFSQFLLWFTASQWFYFGKLFDCKVNRILAFEQLFYRGVSL